jgi:hypothetical protein
MRRSSTKRTFWGERGETCGEISRESLSYWREYFLLHMELLYPSALLKSLDVASDNILQRQD